VGGDTTIGKKEKNFSDGDSEDEPVKKIPNKRTNWDDSMESDPNQSRLTAKKKDNDDDEDDDDDDEEDEEEEKKSEKKSIKKSS